MKKIVVPVFCLCFIAGCNTLKELSDVRRPDVTFSKMSIRDISFSDVTLLFDFEVNNPNGFGVSANQYQYEFFINGSEFVTGIQNENLHIERESVTTIQVPVSLTYSEVLNSIRSVARNDSVSYRLSTEVQFDIAGLGQQRVPVSAEGEIPVPRLPKIELSRLNVEELSFSGAEIIAAFRVVNPNSFGLSMAGMAYNLQVNGKNWLDTRLDRNIRLDGSESEEIVIPIRLNASQMGPVLVEMLSGETEFDYQLTGSARVSANIEGFSGYETIPFDLSGTYSID